MKDVLIEILVGAAIALSGGLLYFLGNLIFGFQRSGGKRLIVFVVGTASLLGSVALFVMISKSGHPEGLGPTLLMLLAGALGIFGCYLACKSFFASAQAIDKWFDRILQGL